MMLPLMGMGIENTSLFMWDVCTNDIPQKHGMEDGTMKCHFLSVLVMLETVFNSFNHVCYAAGGESWYHRSQRK
jgi:hypothetical protein